MELRTKDQKRILYFMLAFCVAFVALAGRVAWLQTVDGAFLKKAATQQQTRDNIITSKRGTIYDRNNKELAVSASGRDGDGVPERDKKSGRQRAGGEKTRRNFVAEL